jgi:uncharacterized membrane protein
MNLPSGSQARAVIPILLAVPAFLLTGCASGEQAAAPSASVQCGTVQATLTAIDDGFADLDGRIAAGASAAQVQPIAGEINKQTNNLLNQLQGADKAALTTVQDASQNIVDTLASLSGSDITGADLAAQVAQSRPAGLDAAIDTLAEFADSVCG